METQKCAQCGKELPKTAFRRIGNRHGGYTYLTICEDCMKARQRAGRERRKQRLVQEELKKQHDMRSRRLSDFTPRELMVELKSRGYKFKMEITETHIINSEDL